MNARDHEFDPDRELAAKFRVGDKDAFRQLHALHHLEILRFVQSNCPRSSDAEDLSQDIWQRVWTKREQFRDGHFRGWLFQVARNILMDGHRRKSLLNIPEEFDVPSPIVHDRADELAALQGCLESLGGDFAQTVRDSLLGVPTEEIAAKYNISVATVYSRKSRGRELLEKCVEEKLK